MILKGKALREHIRNNRGFAAKRLFGQRLYDKQVEIEYQVFDGKCKRTEISGCVGSGKTLGLATTALTWLLAYAPTARVFSLAPSFRQVNANLWGYIKKLWAQAKKNGTPIGDDCDIYDTPSIKFHDPKTGKEIPEWYYEGFSTDEPHNVHGLHGENDLVIIDDAHGISKALCDEIENITAGGNTKLVIAYNKMVLHGPTYDCNHVEARFWNHVGINYLDLVRAREHGWVLPGALGAEAEERWRIKYGNTSNFYRTKVLNLYPKQEKDTLIPLEWIELAYDRKVNDKGPLILGGDFAMQGDDASALAPGRGRMCFEIQEWHEPDAMKTVGFFVKKMKEEESHEDGKAATSSAYGFFDGIGMGGPMINRISEQSNLVSGHRRGCRGCEERLKVEALIGSEAATGRVMDAGVMKDAKDVFKNLRSQIFWNLREALDPSNSDLIGLTRSDDLTAQLSCIRWRVGSDGRIEVEPKIGTSLTGTGKESAWGIKNRLGFSPDQGDATAYLVWGMMRCVHAEYAVAGEVDKRQAPMAAANDRFATAPLPGGMWQDGLEVGGGLDGVN